MTHPLFRETDWKVEQLDCCCTGLGNDFPPDQRIFPEMRLRCDMCQRLWVLNDNIWELDLEKLPETS